jgi:hypothetical protein
MNGISPTEYSQWYYLIYLIPGGCALLVLALSALMSAGHDDSSGNAGHGGHDMSDASDVSDVSDASDTASSHELAVGHHDSLDVNLGDHGAGAHGQHHAGHSDGDGDHHSLAHRMLTAAGVGRVPLPFVWGSGLLGWGLFGFWGTQFLQGHLHAPGLFVGPSLAVALAGAVLTNKAITTVAAKVLPRDESYATSTVDLCGQIGTVVFEVSGTRGRVHVYDAHGTLHDARARIAGGGAPIPRGRKVLVSDYDPSADLVVVEEIL